MCAAFGLVGNLKKEDFMQNTAYIVFEKTLFDSLVSKMDSKTITILSFLIEKATKNNNEITFIYKDIETALKLGHTNVGKNIRLLLNLGAIEKTGNKKYRINIDLIQVLEQREILS